jgi:hypothetical protein
MSLDDPGPPSTRPTRWRGLLVLIHWGILSAGLMSLAWTRLAPTRELSALLRVDPPAGTKAASDKAADLKIQIDLVQSPEVLRAATQDPRVAALGRIKDAPDPVAELRKGLKVEAIPGALEFSVSTVSRTGEESAAIVPAVVEAYMKEGHYGSKVTPLGYALRTTKAPPRFWVMLAIPFAVLPLALWLDLLWESRHRPVRAPGATPEGAGHARMRMPWRGSPVREARPGATMGPDSPIPARIDPMPPRDPQPPRAGFGDLLGRTLRRRWLPILTQWGILGTALMLGAHYALPAGYESTAWLEVDLSRHALWAPQGDPALSISAQSVETHARLITSPEVLAAAVADPRAATLPTIRNSADPEAELRRNLRVSIVPNTRLILVSLASPNPSEAADLANAVVDSYLKGAADRTDREVLIQIEQLRDLRLKFENERDKQRATLRKLNQQAVQSTLVDAKDPDLIALDHYRLIRKELAANELERVKANAQLATLRKRHEDDPTNQARAAKMDELEAQIETSLRAERDLRQKLKSVDISTRAETNEALEIEFLRGDLKYSDQMIETIERNLGQLEYKAHGPTRVSLASRAKAARQPVDHRRPVVLAAIPPTLLAALIGLFMLVEARATRIAAARTPAAATPDTAASEPS